MKQNFLILLLAAAALSGCDDETVTPVQPQTTESKPMSFSISTANFYDPTNPATRSSGLTSLTTPTAAGVLEAGILLSCYNVTGDSILFSNYIYKSETTISEDGESEKEVISFKDINGNDVATPMWPGSDNVVFYAYYVGDDGSFYSEDELYPYDYTIRENGSKNFCVGINNTIAVMAGSDLLACTVSTSSKKGTTVQLNLQHILTQFKVTAQRASDNDSINVTSFSVFFPDTVVYDFNEGKVMRIDGVTNTDSIKASPYPVKLGANGFSAYQYEAGYDEDNGTEYAASISSYNQSVALTETGSGEDYYYWHFAVPDSLVFDFGYQLIYATTAWVDKTGHLVVKPAAGQKISYVVSMGASTSGGTTTNDGGTVGTGSN